MKNIDHIAMAAVWWYYPSWVCTREVHDVGCRFASSLPMTFPDLPSRQAFQASLKRLADAGKLRRQRRSDGTSYWSINNGTGA